MNKLQLFANAILAAVKSRMESDFQGIGAFLRTKFDDLKTELTGLITAAQTKADQAKTLADQHTGQIATLEADLTTLEGEVQSVSQVASAAATAAQAVRTDFDAFKDVTYVADKAAQATVNTEVQSSLAAIKAVAEGKGTFLRTTATTGTISSLLQTAASDLGLTLTKGINVLHNNTSGTVSWTDEVGAVRTVKAGEAVVVNITSVSGGVPTFTTAADVIIDNGTNMDAVQAAIDAAIATLLTDVATLKTDVIALQGEMDAVITATVGSSLTSFTTGWGN